MVDFWGCEQAKVIQRILIIKKFLIDDYAVFGAH
jgi:hypothetical protein